MKKYIIIIYLMLTLILFGCNSLTNEDKVIQSISFSTNELILKANEMSILPITIEGLNDDDIIYSITDQEIVKVDGIVVEALQIGHTTITATSKHDDSVLATIDVVVEAINVKTPVLTTPTEYITVNGKTALMLGNIKEVGASMNSFSITVSDESIIKVDEDFIITGLKEGTVTIFATLKSNPDIKSSVNLTVSNINNPERRLILKTKEPNSTVQAGEYMEIFIEGLNKKDYYFKSYANTVAMVTDDGRAIGVKEGTAEIAAFLKSNNKVYGTITVTVTGVPNVDYAARLVEIALAEEGYEEGNNDETKYGAWYNLNYNAWCAMFVSWAANQSGINGNIIPKYASVSNGREWFEYRGQFRYKGSYTPKAGDIIFFLGPGISHTGIVVRSDGTRVYTIEGNTSDIVAQRSYLLTDIRITGYGIPNYATFNK